MGCISQGATVTSDPIDQGAFADGQGASFGRTEDAIFGGGGGGSNNGGNHTGNGGEENRTLWAMGVEKVSGRFSDGISSHDVNTSSQVGKLGWIAKTFVDGFHSNSQVGKTTGHLGGDIHRHGTHWHGEDGRLHGWDRK